MPFWLLGAHILGAVATGIAGRTSISRALGVASLAPLVTTIWAAAALIRDGDPTTSELQWVEGLGLSFRFQTTDLALLMTLLISGIGTLVFIYAIGYFGREYGPGIRFPVSLLAFSTSMLGLVWADSVWTLFIFWEFTSITSFLLVGHKHTDHAVRTAARRALAITGVGGLVLLAGLLVLVQETGTATLSEMTTVGGTAGTLAAVLVIVGAATKSAQVPFHVWLPGAMAAPTPVSAYLHSATMVKAGVFLIAVLGPILSDVDAWKPVAATFGIVSMLWGGVVALRHRDAKLILAWGTISQLGLLVTMLSIGTAKATFAAIALLFAHALFKAALFLVVGEVDVRTGTRDIAELGGLHRSMPVAFGVAVAAGISMAGAPPLLGFMAKEAAIEAALKLDGAEQVIFLGAVSVGSVLTVTYTLRFLWGVFGPGPNTTVKAGSVPLGGPAVVLGVLSVLGYILPGVSTDIVRDAAVALDPDAVVYKLIAWPGLKTAFVISLIILTTGAVVGSWLLRRPMTEAPRAFGADQVDGSIDGLLATAPAFIGRIQHGSLPVYVATFGLVTAIATLPFLGSLESDHLQRWDNGLEPILAVVIVGAAVAATFVGSRLGAALSLGAVGLGVSAIFVIRGAPDLALTQLLVETVVVVGFVLGLGRLRRQFPKSENAWQMARVGIAIGGGFGVMAALVAATGNPAGTAPIDELTAGAVEEGGGKNIVNVILTDIRALDTLGEVVVLATVAIGILALARVRNSEVTT